MGLLIEIRNALREKKDFELTDRIRTELSKYGFILEDEKGRTTWKRTH